MCCNFSHIGMLCADVDVRSPLGARYLAPVKSISSGTYLQARIESANANVNFSSRCSGDDDLSHKTMERCFCYLDSIVDHFSMPPDILYCVHTQLEDL